MCDQDQQINLISRGSALCNHDASENVVSWLIWSANSMLLVVILNSSVVVTHFVMLFVKSHLNVHLRLRGREILFKCHCGLTPYETKVTTGPTTDDRLSNLEGKTYSHLPLMYWMLKRFPCRLLHLWFTILNLITHSSTEVKWKAWNQ